MRQTNSTVKLVYLLLTPILIIYGLIHARDFLYPLAYAVLLSYVLLPVVKLLEKKGLPRILAILIAIIVIIIFIVTAFVITYNQVSQLGGNFESIRKSALQNIESFQNMLETTFGLQHKSAENFLKNTFNSLIDEDNGGVKKIFSATTDTIVRLALLPVFIFLFLFYRTKFAYFILKIVSRRKKQLTIDILREISNVAARYLGGVLIVVLILCFINTAGLLIIGVKYAILLGIISALFNLIPYFGTLMGGAVPLIFVLFTTPDPFNIALSVVFLFLIIQFTENNILTPNIVGGNVNINPFFIILGLIAGAMIWGIPGMLVAVPFLAIIRIIFNHIDSLKPYAFLLGKGGAEKHSLTMTKIKKRFRILKNKN